ncbi:MAG: peptide chain release factor N(5)-glutamine methyltransferase [Deltaproteobacteria bacterium]|nr:MAG: peptide chain release factor N(5)-glutamine methyltransferase [Deltaproteobacteria bacterium]
MSETWTVLDILKWTTGFFEKLGIDSPRLTAELLLAHVLGLARIQLYVQFERPLDPIERQTYRELVKRRAAGEPVQYILGDQEFWSLSFVVRPGVLVPRADTEVLVEEAVAIARELAGREGEGLRIADVGTGSGAIAVALAHELPAAALWADDIADVPLEVAPQNAAAAGVGERVTVLRGAGLTPLLSAAGPFDVVCSNPPYIRAGDLAGLMREVRDWEPLEALVSGADGLDVLRVLVDEVTRPGALRPDGAVLFEIGDGPQAETVGGWLAARGFTGVRVRKDYGGRPRVVIARGPAWVPAASPADATGAD